MFVKSAVAVALLASFTAAATTANSTIDPTTIDASDRSAWCSSEINVCGTLCSGNVDDNECDTTSLNYTCTCASNSSTPGLQYYTGTMPTFICEKIYENCIVAGENDAAAQKACTTARDTNCGTLDPTNFTAAATTTSSSSSATATATATATSSGTASSASASASATGNAAVGSYQAGAGVLAAGVAAAFGFLL